MKPIKIFILIFLMLGQFFTVQSQVISTFDWDSNPVTGASFGPNGSSVSGSATSSPNGVGGTNGLNAGLPKADIGLIIPGNHFSNLKGVDFQIDFQRDETRGDFISCGNNFAFGMMNGELYVHFKTEYNSVVDSVEALSIYPIPDDDVFRNYRFYYLPGTGYAEVLVNDSIVWSHNGNADDLAWSNDDVVIGKLMDGNGMDKVVFDNMVLGEVYDSPLPVELSSFDASLINNEVHLDWVTESEKDNDYFTLEKSRDGVTFRKFGSVPGAGYSLKEIQYSYVDENPYSGISYYRLKQTDYNGEFTFSEIESIEYSDIQIKVYPTLIEKNGVLHVQLPSQVGEIRTMIQDPLGNVISQKYFSQSDKLTLKVPQNSGIYFIQIIADGVRAESKKIIVR